MEGQEEVHPHPLLSHCHHRHCQVSPLPPVASASPDGKKLRQKALSLQLNPLLLDQGACQMLPHTLCLLCLLSLLRQFKLSSAGPDSVRRLLVQLLCCLCQGRALPSQSIQQMPVCPACQSHPHLPFRLTPLPRPSLPLLGRMGKHKQRLPCKLWSRCCKPRGTLMPATLHHPLPALSSHRCLHISHRSQGLHPHSRHCHRCPHHSQHSQMQWALLTVQVRHHLGLHSMLRTLRHHLTLGRRHRSQVSSLASLICPLCCSRVCKGLT